MSTFNPSKIPMSEAEQARYDGMDPDTQLKYLRTRRQLLYERHDNIDLFGHVLTGELEQERQATAKSADVTKQLQARDTALWQALRAEYAELFAELDKAQQASDEASYAVADALADLDAHHQRKPRNPQDIPAWSTRKNILQDVYSAHKGVHSDLQDAYNQAVARLTTAIDASMRQWQEQAAQAYTAAEHEAKRIRAQADALIQEAQATQQDTYRLEARITKYGILGIIAQEDERS